MFEQCTVACIAAVALGAAACGSGGDSATAGSGGPLKLTVGQLLPLSGTLAAYGPAGRKAAELAAAEIERAAARTGVRDEIEIAVQDDQSDPQAAVAGARQLVGGGRIPCLVGSYASADTIPVARAVTIPRRILQITGVSSADEISDLDDDGFVNRAALPDSFQGKAIAQAVADDLGGAQGKVVNVGARNDAFGTGLTRTFTASWKALGGRIGQSVAYDPSQPSYDAEAAKIAGGNPDAWVIIDFPDTFKKVGPALLRTGAWSPAKTFSNDAMGAPDVPEQVGSKVVEGLRGAAPAAPARAAAAKAFDRAYRSAPGPARNTFDVQVFDATMLCYLAAVAAGSTDPAKMKDELAALTAPGGERYAWLQLDKAVEALRAGRDIDFDGASGPLDLNDKGDPTAGVYDLYTFEGGRLEVLEQVEVGAR